MLVQESSVVVNSTGDIISGEKIGRRSTGIPQPGINKRRIVQALP
jgi:hypothetical protein